MKFRDYLLYPLIAVSVLLGSNCGKQVDPILERAKKVSIQDYLSLPDTTFSVKSLEGLVKVDSAYRDPKNETSHIFLTKIKDNHKVEVVVVDNDGIAAYFNPDRKIYDKYFNAASKLVNKYRFVNSNYYLLPTDELKVVMDTVKIKDSFIDIDSAKTIEHRLNLYVRTDNDDKLLFVFNKNNENLEGIISLDNNKNILQEVRGLITFVKQDKRFYKNHSKEEGVLLNKVADIFYKVLSSTGEIDAVSTGKGWEVLGSNSFPPGRLYYDGSRKEGNKTHIYVHLIDNQKDERADFVFDKERNIEDIIDLNKNISVKSEVDGILQSLGPNTQVSNGRLSEEKLVDVAKKDFYLKLTNDYYEDLKNSKIYKKELENTVIPKDFIVSEHSKLIKGGKYDIILITSYRDSLDRYQIGQYTIDTLGNIEYSDVMPYFEGH